MAQQLLAAPDESQYDWRFELKDVPVRVHPLFWIIAALIAYGPAGDDLLHIGIGIVCVFVSILAHEFGHALSGRRFGDHNNTVVLYMMGGLCIPGYGSMSHWQRILHIFWGPLVSFILGAIGLGLYLAVKFNLLPPLPEAVVFTFFFMGLINLSWTVLNIVPVFPLDGGQIVREWLMWKRPSGGEALSCMISMVAGILIAIAFIAYGILTHTVHIFPVIMFLYFAYKSWEMRKNVLTYGSSDGPGVDDEPRAAWEQDPDWWKKGGG